MTVAYSDNLIYNSRVDRFATEKADSDRPATLIHRMNTTEVFMINDLTNRKFGKLTVLNFDHKEQKYVNGKPNGNVYFYLCKCDCGNEVVVQYGNLTSGSSTQCKKCGDKQASEKKRKHNGKGTRLYRIWKNMRVRCTNSNSPYFKNYGGRGISICSEWNDFVVFQNWALQNGYADNLSIDRIDVNGNYEPSNCRWATQREQCQNQRKTHNVAINGETHCIAEWARIYNIHQETIKDRIKRGWDEVKAVTTPVKEKV